MPVQVWSRPIDPFEHPLRWVLDESVDETTWFTLRCLNCHAIFGRAGFSATRAADHEAFPLTAVLRELRRVRAKSEPLAREVRCEVPS